MDKKAQHYARLMPVCSASNRSLQAFWSREDTSTKDAENRVACPRCGKVVRLYQASNERWPNTIPHHHEQRKPYEG